MAGAFEVAETISRAELASRWARGDIAASPDTEAALAPLLGTRAAVPLGAHPTFDAGRWGIVPVHELSPAWRVIPIDGQHPLDGDGAPLVARVCGKTPIANFDRGPSTLPIFFNRISGNAFVDYGSAFDDAATAKFKTGTGGELWFDATLGYVIGFTFRLGFAHGWASGGMDKAYFVAAVPF